MRLEKHELRRRWSELRELVNAWDPIGVIGIGAPLDEYDCLIGPLLRMLESGESDKAIVAYLHREGTEHFGVVLHNADAFAVQAKDWYEQRWPRATT